MIKLLLIVAILFSPYRQSDTFLPVERQIANLPYERAVAYDSAGKLLFNRAGQAHQVNIIYKDMHALWDGTLSHNHPSGIPVPSYSDLVVGWYWQLKEIRVVAGNKLRIMRRAGRFWNMPPENVYREVFAEALLGPCRDSDNQLLCAGDKTWETLARSSHFEYIEVG